MLKNKIIVRKIRNIVILLMVIIIMIGAYKNINKSRAEDVIEIGAIALDNYGYLENERFVLEAKQTEDNLFEIELPNAINGKKINKIVKISLGEFEEATEQVEDEVTQNSKTEIVVEQGIELIENKIYLTEEQKENEEINMEVEYDIAILNQDEDNTYSKTLLKEKNEEERKQLKEALATTQNVQMLYNKNLRYEDKEKGKQVELNGYLPVDAQLQVEELSQEEITKVFGSKQIEVAYDIKIIQKVVTTIPVDEANPKSEPEEIIEIIEINPEEFGEKCEVTIIDSKIEEKSKVLHVKEDNTLEEVSVTENAEGNVSFEAEKFSIYGVETVSETANEQITTYASTTTTNPYIPTGYTQVSGTDLSNGLTIQDSSGNQYVWVEVPTTLYDNTSYNNNGNKKPSSSTDYDKIEYCLQQYAATYRTRNQNSYGVSFTDSHNLINANYRRRMLKSVYENGGFYVGKYETGYIPTNGKFRTSASDAITHTPVIQQNVIPYNFITPTQAGNLALSFKTDGYETGLLWGIQWDLILKHLETKNVATVNELNVDSSGWGNYITTSLSRINKNAYYFYNNTGYSGATQWYGKPSGTSFLFTTGASTLFERGGIYDLAGNTFEFTNEVMMYNGSVQGAVIRGGDGERSESEVHYASAAGVAAFSNAWAFGGFRVGLYATEDEIAPTATSYEIKNITKDGYDVYVYGVTDNSSGVNVVQTGTWTEANGQDDVVWTNGTDLENGTWYFRVNASDHNNEEGTYCTNIFTIDNAGNSSLVFSASAYVDRTAPTATSWEIKNVTKDGYDVYVYGVTDNYSGVNRVQFPTWTTANGQDDIQSSWQTNSTAKGTDQGNGTWYFRVNASDHNNEQGTYNTHVYAFDNAGNHNCIFTGTAYVDRTGPTITLGANSNTTYAKTQSVTVTISDNYSGLKAGQKVKYGWSTSTSTAPSYTSVTLSNAAGATSTTFTASGSGLTGKYYLWVVPDTSVSDAQNNTTTSTVKSTGTFYFDNTAPTITLGANSNTTYAKTQSVTVTLADANSGLAAGTSQSVKYGWSTSTSTAPSSYTTASLTNSAGAASTTFTASGSGLTGQYYLWVVPTTYKDKVGNQNSTTVKSTGTFYFDNTAPTISYTAFYSADNSSYTSGTWTNKEVRTTISSTEAHSGVVAIQYTKTPSTESSWSTLSLGISGGIQKSGTTYSGTENWSLREREDKYYFRAKDGAGNVSATSSEFFIKYDLTKPTKPTYTAFHPSDNASYTSGTWTNYAVNTTISSTDSSSTSGVGSSGIKVIQYSTDKTNWTTFSFSEGALTQSGNTWSGTEPWGLRNRDNSYYFKAIDNVGNESAVSSSYDWNIKYDISKPTISVNTTSCTWRNSALSVTITATDTGGAGLPTTATSFQYYLSNSSTALTTGDWTGDTWTNYTSGTAISLNPGKTGTYYLFVRRVNDNAGNTTTSNGTDTTVSSTVYHRYGAYQFEYDVPVWTYSSKDIYYSTANDVGNDDIANKDRTVKITFKGTDVNTNVTSSLTANDISVTVKNSSGTTVTTVANANKSLTTSTNNGTAKEVTCTLTITGITGDGTLTVEIPSGKLTDQASNKNVATALTTSIGITIDNVSPTLSLAVKSPTTGKYYKAGQVITITATYTENVYKERTSNNLIDSVAEAPAMALTFGGAASKNSVTCSSVSGKVITYTYTIKAPTTTGGTNGDNGLMVISSLGTVYDKAGNAVSASNVSLDIGADTTNPTVSSITANRTSPTNANNITYTVVFSEAVTGFSSADVTVNSGKGSVTSVTGSGTTWSVVVSTKDNENYSETITIKANGATIDRAGNKVLTAKTSTAIQVDRIEPNQIVITSNRTSPTNADSITYTIVFNEAVTGFTKEDITVNSGKGTVTSLSGSGTTYTAVVSTTDNQEYTESITLATGICTDTAGNTNTAKTSDEILVDRIDPTITSITANKTSPTNADSITYTIVFGEAVTGFAKEDITVNSGKGSVTSVSGSGTTYTAVVTTTDNQQYTETITISAGKCIDKAGNGNVAKTSDGIVVDRIDPTVTSITANKTSPTNADNITYTIVFSEAVTGFAKEDIVVNSGKGSVSSLTGSGTTYTAVVTTKDNQEYTETITIPAGKCIDKAGNGNVAKTSDGIVVDRIDPTISSITANRTSPTNADSITYTIVFSEAVTGFEKEDIIVNSTKGSVTSVSGSGTTYTAVVTTTDNQEYTETITIPAGKCIDKAGNGNVTKTSTGIVVDRVDPTWTYVSKDIYLTNPNDVGNDNYANADRTVKIVFKGTDANGHNVTSTLTSDAIAVSVNGTAVANTNKSLQTVNSPSAEVTCTLTITGITGNGDLTVVIPSSTLTDHVSNTNSQTALTTDVNIDIDNTSPTVSFAVTSPASGTYKSGQAITITATYTENVYKEVTSNNLIDTKAEAPTLSLKFGNTDAKGTATCTAVNGKVITYSYTIQGPTSTGGTDGDNGILKIASIGIVYDVAGNSVSASNVTPSPQITADTIAPTVTITANKTSYTNSANITYTFTFSENVIGLTADDVTVSNGTKGTLTEVSASVYTLVVSTIDDAVYTETVSVAANKCTDIAGNGNIVSNSLGVNVDRKNPTITATPDKTTNASANNYQKSQSVTITVADAGAGLSSSNSYQYYLSNSSSALSGGEWTNYTSGTPFTIGTGLTGDYYLFVKTVKDNVTDSTKNESSTNGTIKTLGGVKCHMFGTYKFDNTAPYWKIGTPNISTSSKNITVDIIGTDDHGGYGSNTLDNGDISVWVDGTLITNITKTLSAASTVTEGVKYTLTLSNFEEAVRQEGKSYKEWSGETKIVITSGTLKDKFENESTEKTFILGHADFIKPEFTYIFSGTTRDETPSANPDINYDTKTVKVVFSVTDKYFDSSKTALQYLTVSDLIIKVDGEVPQWRSAEGSTGVTRTLTGTEITETRATGTVTIGYEYTLTLSNLQQDPNDGLDYSGVITVEIPANKFEDTSDNKNDLQIITVGSNVPPTEEEEGEEEEEEEEKEEEVYPYIPEGYTQVSGTDLSNGLTIQDSLGNQYVWVEVPKTLYENASYNNNGNRKPTSSSDYYNIEYCLQKYAETYRGRNSQSWDGYTFADRNSGVEGYDMMKNNILKSIYENGGFYVGKYETGIGGNGTARTSASQAITQPAVIQANKNVYNYVNIHQAGVLSTSLGSSGYPTGLLYGFMWDLVLKHLEVKNEATVNELSVNSTSWGNYSRGLLKTGSSSQYEKGGIYDLAGNVEEWTAETAYQDTWPVGIVVRGGSYSDSSSIVNMAMAALWRDVDESTKDKGFRVALIREGGSTSTETPEHEIPGAGGIEEGIVDVVDPVWTMSESSVDTKTFKFRTRDKFYKSSHLNADDITIYSNGVISTEIEKTITGPVEITQGQEYEYTLTLSNITPDDGSGGDGTGTAINTSFEPTNKSELVEGTNGFKYRVEYGGNVLIKIAAGTITDTSGNQSQETTFAVGTVDDSEPQIYEVQKTQNASANTETIIFNVTDKNYDYSDLITKDEITLWIDNVEVSSLINNATLTYKPINANVDATEKTVGHQYTLVISNISEVVKQTGKDYLEYSGTLKITIDEDAAKDIKGNTLNTDTTTITDFIDYIMPQIEYTYSSSNIDKTNKKYTMTFTVVDKYYTSGVLALNDIEVDIVDGKNIYDLKEELPENSITLTSTAINVNTNVTNPGTGVVEAVTGHTIGHTYTVTIENLEQLVVETGNTTADYSGIIKVVIPADKILDREGNGNVNTSIVSGYSYENNGAGVSGSLAVVDVVDPIWAKVSSSAYVFNPTNKTTSIAILTIKGTDTYFNTSDTDASTLAADEIEIYIDGIKNTSIAPNISTATALNETRNVLNSDGDLTSDTETVQYGVEYTITLNGWNQDAHQVKIKILEDAITDQSGNGNKETEFIIYNTLTSATSETSETSKFLNSSTIQRQEIEKIEFVNNINGSTADGVQMVWDVSARGDNSILAWYSQTSEPYTVYIGSKDEIFANQDSSYLFSYIGYSGTSSDTQTILNLNLLNTSSVTDMSFMFQYCGHKAMTSLTLPNTFDTSNVTDMQYMFSNCGYTAMTSLTLPSSFDTSNVDNMQGMFESCGYTAMTGLTLPTAFNTGSVTNMSYMFQNCGYTAMTSLTLPAAFNTGNVTNMSYMFSHCGYTAMTGLSLGSNFDTTSVTNMSYMFQNCGYTAMTSLSLGSNFDTKNVTDMSGMFAECGYTAMTSITLGSNFNTEKVQNMSQMFYYTGYSEMTSLDLGTEFNTSTVTNMNKMFNGLGGKKLTSLDLGDFFYTTNVTDMEKMFNECGSESMTILDLGPLFTKIADTNEDFMTNAGKSGCVVYAPEAIYSSQLAFKLNNTDTTNTISYTKGTINPIYRPQWTKVSSSITGQTISIVLKGNASQSQTLDSGKVKINYSSNVTTDLTANDITVYINGVEATWITKVLPSASPATGAEVTQTLTLSGFEETTRQLGVPFKEWSGNIQIRIGGRGQATSTYTANKLIDVYGNQNMMQTDQGQAGGTWIDVKLADTDVTQNTTNTMFADFIKPEFTYEYSNTTIVRGDIETVTVVFDVTDKYFASTTLSSLDGSQITISVDDYNVTELNNYLDTNNYKQLTKIKDVYYDATAGTTYVDSGATGTGTKVGERYQLVISGLDTDDAFKYSGYMTLSFAEGTITDTSNNISVATSITIGKDDVDGNPGQDTTENGTIVDVVDPIWQLGTTNLEDGTIKLITKDKYFNTSTIDEDDITVYVNGIESTSIVKDISSIEPTNIYDTVNGVVNTVVGKEYTLQLSNIVPSGGGYTTFVPTNLTTDSLNDVEGFKYRSENGGAVSLQIAAGVTTDTSGNGNNVTILDVGAIDVTKPEIYEVQKIQNASENTETIIFNVTDRNYDSTELITKGEMTLWIDNVLVDSLKDSATLTYKPIKLNIDGVEEKIVGHQYTLVISNIAETTKQTGKDYLEWSGTLKITIDEDAAKDSKGNTLNTETTTITDFVDYIKPQIEQVTVTNPINTTDKTYTMSFKVIDKYLYDSNAEDIDMITTDEITVYVDGEPASSITKNISSSPITASMNKTVNGAVTSGNYTIGHTYTLVLGGFEQSEKQDGKDFMEWSGTVKIVIAQNATSDTSSNTFDADETKRTVNGEHVDFIKPVLEEVSKTRGTNTETIVFNVMDKYLANADTNVVATSEITVYVDGEAVTVDYTNSSSTGLNGVLTKVQNFTATVNGDSTHIVGQQYQLVLSGFEQASRNDKNYSDYSGTVSIELAQNTVADTATNTLASETAKRTITGDFVDFIKPELQYTHSSSNINTGNKTYTMTFDVTDKYYDSDDVNNVLTLADLTITMQSGQLDGSGAVKVHDLKALADQGKIDIAFSKAKQSATFKKTVEGVVETTATSHDIGYTYTLTISKLDQLEIQGNDSTVNYSGIINVVVAQNQVADKGTSGDGTNTNKNVETSITSGVNIPGGTGSGTVVDVVSPVFDKISSSAYAFNPTNTASSIATITFKATDTYFVEGSGITVDDIQVVVNGTVVSSGITKTITATTELEEDRIVNGVEQNDVQYGVQYTLEITGWAQNANQVKIRIPAEKLTDQNGNKNIVTDMILYNCLELTNTEVDATSGFLGNSSIDRQEVQNLTFLSTTSGAPVDGDGNINIDNNNCWDVSAQNDKSIIAWRTSTAPYTVYIGSYDEIFANQNSSYLFSCIGSGTSIATETITNLNKLNTNSVTNMIAMFANCGSTAMTALHLGDAFNTSNVTLMTNMFSNTGKTNMTTMTLGSNFNTAKVTDMSGMFEMCGNEKLTGLNLGEKFYTSEVTNMSTMFNGCGTTALTTFSLGSNFNTIKVENMSGMFQDFAYNLATLNLGTSFNTSAVEDMSNMFKGCGQTSMTTLTLGENFNTSAVQYMNGMFQDFAKNSTTMTSLDLKDQFYTIVAADMSNMFNGCGQTAMVVLDLGPAFTKIATSNTDFMKDCGKSTLVIYAPESIYLDRTSFKLHKLDGVT